MIVWLNGAFGAGKTTTAFELHRRLAGSFVYDPENVGYFIRRNAPRQFSKGDFQDIPLWREMNYEMLKMLAAQYSGIIIVPMTLVSPDYYAQLVGRLASHDIDMRHFILTAGRETLQRRLRRRSPFGRDTFALGSIDRCLAAFDGVIPGVKMDTEALTVDGVVEAIATECGLPLSPGRRSRFGRLLYRLRVTVKHIR